MRFGVIGTGRIGSFHARVLAEQPVVSKIVVLDRHEEKAIHVAEQVRGRVATSVDDMLASVDAVVIATPTAAHAENIRQVAAAGLPMFCEKPIAIDLQDTSDIVEFVRRSGAVVQVGFQRRFDAGYSRAQRLVADGSIGRIYAVRLASHDPDPPPESYMPGSGGIFRDLHIHDFDIARFVTGQDIVEVYADGGVLGFEFLERYNDLDTAVAVLRFSGGTFGILSGTRHDPLGCDVRMEVFGARDSVTVGVDGRTPLRSLEDGVLAPVDPYSFFLNRFAAAYRAELAAFIEVAAGRLPNPCSPDDALAAMRVSIACETSRHEHRPVRLSEVL